MEELKSLKETLTKVKTNTLPVGVRNKLNSLLEDLEEEINSQEKTYSIAGVLTEDEEQLLYGEEEVTKEIVSKILSVYLSGVLGTDRLEIKRIMDKEFLNVLDKTFKGRVCLDNLLSLWF